MNLFKRLLKISPACIHDQSVPAQSEIGHNAVRRYYWICNKCGAKIYIEDFRVNAKFLPSGF